MVAGMRIYAFARGWGNSLFFVLLGLLLFGLPLLQPISTYALRGADAPDLEAGIAAIRKVVKTLPARREASTNVSAWLRA